MTPVADRKDKPQYIDSLDSLRGLAVLPVLFLHGSYGRVPGGWIGVDLFFVLSGYLITSLLQKEYLATNDISLSNFYARRALRLFPPLIIGVLLANILWPLTTLPPGGNQLLATLAALFYSTNLISEDLAGNMNHLWSLSVEEHFYFIWPLVTLFLVFRMPVRERILFLIVLILMAAIFRIVLYNYFNYTTFGILIMDAYQFTPCRIDGILMGALLFFLFSEPQFNNLNLADKSKGTLFIIALFSIFIIIILTVRLGHPYWYNGGFMLINLLCALTVWIAIKKPHHFLFSNKVFRWIGKRSYGLYVYHLPIFWALEGLREHHSMSNFLLVTLLRFIISFAVAAVSYTFIEQPILRFKKRYEIEKLSAVTKIN